MALCIILFKQLTIAEPKAPVLRSLTVITKVLQNIANMGQFSPKDDMYVVNDYITDRLPTMCESVDILCSLPEEPLDEVLVTSKLIIGTNKSCIDVLWKGACICIVQTQRK